VAEEHQVGADVEVEDSVVPVADLVVEVEEER